MHRQARMKTYNGVIVPPLIRVDRIMSAFENGIDQHKVEAYTEAMRVLDVCHEFPPILGFPSVIDEDDVGALFLTRELVEDTMIGEQIWKVTDGHHRSLAAIEAGLSHLEVELDYSCITDPAELKQWDV